MQAITQQSGRDGTQRMRVEAVVETLAALHGEGESLAGIAHDARNMVSALALYCDLLEEPGVLAPAFRHYGDELRLVAAASRRLVEKLVAFDGRTAASDSQRVQDACALLHPDNPHMPLPAAPPVRRSDLLPPTPVGNLAGALLANRSLLSALAGPSIALTVDTTGGDRPVMLTGEDLTRVLVNLVRNAVEASPAGGGISIGLHETDDGWLALSIDDCGPGIPGTELDRIFEPGYTTHGDCSPGGARRGLGLSVTRTIVEAAGGRIRAENRQRAGARFEILLPVRTG